MDRRAAWEYTRNIEISNTQIQKEKQNKSGDNVDLTIKNVFFFFFETAH